jgi:hypothetical protein
VTDDIIRRDRRAVLADLPEICAAAHPTEGIAILIKRGERGYWPSEGMAVDEFNARRGITPAQREAMLHGSVFGFDAPIADPLNHINQESK